MSPELREGLRSDAVEVDNSSRVREAGCDQRQVASDLLEVCAASPQLLDKRSELARQNHLALPVDGVCGTALSLEGVVDLAEDVEVCDELRCLFGVEF